MVDSPERIVTTAHCLGAGVFLLILLGCGSTPNAAVDGPAIRDSAGIRIVENERPTWTVPWHVAEDPSLVVGSVEDNAGRALYQVTGALRLADGRIVIANAGTYELRFYNEAGEFLASSGGQGGGPGEFSSLELISRYGPDSIIAVDVRNHRVSYFDAAGRFCRSVRLEPSADIPVPRALGIFSDGSLLATKGLFVLGARLPARTERDEQQLFRYRPDGLSAEDVGSFPGIERAVFETGRVNPSGQADVIRLERRFGTKTAYAVAGDRFYVADNASYEIQVHSLAGRLTHLFRKRHAPLEVTDADVRALEDSMLAAETDLVLRRSWDHRPSPPATMPAYAPEIHLDSELNLWVREYTRPGDPQWSYSVFDSSGVFLGDVVVPNGLVILDIGQDYVLGVWRDELDVEYVLLYELHKDA